MKLMKRRGTAFAAAMAMASMPLVGAFVGASTAMAAESPTPSIAATASATSSATSNATTGSQADDLQAADGRMRGGPDGDGGPGGNDGHEGPGYGRYHKPGFVEGRRDDDEHFTDLEMVSGVLLGAVLGGAGVAGSSYVVRRRRQKKAEREAVNAPAASADVPVSPVNIPVAQQPSAFAASSADGAVNEPAKTSEPAKKTTKTDTNDAEVNNPDA